MNCEQTRLQINALIDGEVNRQTREALQQHIAHCDACRALVEAQKIQHRELLDAFVGTRETSDQFADAIVAAISNAPAPPTSNLVAAKPSSPFWANLGPIVAALAAGFLIAVLIFQPWQKPSNETANKNVEPTVEQFGKISVASTSLEMATEPDRWQSCSLNHEVFAGTQLRTANDMGAELQGLNSPTIRLDKNSQIAIRSASSIELLAGRISLHSTDQPASVTVDDKTFSLRSGAFVLRHGVSGLEVTVLDGTLIVNHKELSTTVSAGTSVELNSQGLATKSSTNSLQGTRWLGPILAQKKNDPELAKRVQQLLSEIGQSKLDHLQVDEIRSLGHAAATPLIAYLNSNATENQDLQKRQTAARLLADVASYEDVELLIKLLDDPDPSVTQMIERGLSRITGRQPKIRKAKVFQPDQKGWKNWLNNRQTDDA
jgi:ferric-dicitrate binding protein FerR (iron transport regulator)